MKRFAGYALVRALGHGNHGTFHLAKPPPERGLGRDEVALKILDRHASDNEFKRMAAELEVLLELQHPRLVPVLDAGHEEGRLFYATTYYADGSLPVGPDGDPRRAAALVADAAEAAHALHERGVAHRDIKPSNILMAAGRGHLGDLGVANYLDARFTATGARPVGTLTYSDPRLIHGDRPGRASDIWSLAATLHMAVTGRSLIGDIPNAQLVQAIEYVLSAEARIEPSVPGPLAAIIGRAAQPDPADRHGTALELAADLRAWAGVTPLAGDGGTDVLAPDRDRVGDDGRRGFPVAERGPTLDRPTYEHPVAVVGLRSPAGWFNRADAVRCRVTGHPRTDGDGWIPERRSRPPLGVLVDGEGRARLLRWDVVIGRQPDHDEAVAAGRAEGIAHPDAVTMSRAHVRLVLDEWSVLAIDGSSNGTRVRSADGQVRLLTRGRPEPLVAGDTLLIEGEAYTFHPTP